jgi:hypothetical protein
LAGYIKASLEVGGEVGGSLAVVHARVGDVVEIAEGAWHMVVTVKAKKHLAWHV